MKNLFCISVIGRSAQNRKRVLSPAFRRLMFRNSRLKAGLKTLDNLDYRVLNFIVVIYYLVGVSKTSWRVMMPMMRLYSSTNTAGFV